MPHVRSKGISVCLIPEVGDLYLQEVPEQADAAVAHFLDRQRGKA